jgi:hypothetical protein
MTPNNPDTTGNIEVYANCISPIEYTRAGLRLTPLAGKAAILKGWTGINLSESQILAWENRGVNWGAITGDPLIVLDTDTEEAESWVQAHGIESPVMVRSGRGVHRWFIKPENVTIIRCRNGLHGIDGLDVKGWHGIIVLPGSIHPQTKKRYEFIDGKEFTGLHELPPFDLKWIQDIRTEPSMKPGTQPSAQVGQSSGQVRNLMGYIMSIPSVEGQGGSNACYRVACLLYDAGKSVDEILAVMVEWNEVCAFPTWSREELAHKVESVIRRKTEQTMK